jgi:predicted nicotinamide N-methyase
MPGYTTRQQRLRLGGHDYRIRSLSDHQQFSDPDGRAERLGISSAQWCLFGQVWPAGRLLANAMGGFDIAGKRILEIGCGLGLASLVLQRRGADVIASDMHPLAEPFRAYNSALTALPSVAYRKLRWGVPLPTLGLFDLVIGSDVLYERDHAEMLASLIGRHTHAVAEVLITDPGRGNSAPFSRALALQGFEVSEERGPMDDDDIPPFRGRLLHYRRSAIAMPSAGVSRQ